jgi:uncharacterized protein with GYD domain
MPKFLYKANYTKDGLAGLLRDGGSGRAKAIDMLADSVGGRVESIYWAFGDTDVYLVVDLPDAVTAGALSAKVALSGAVNITTTQLVTADEMDAIAAKSQNVEYRAPGA